LNSGRFTLSLAAGHPRPTASLPNPTSSVPPSANRSGDPPEFERECVAFFAEVVQVFGVPKSLGQIYGVLYASPEPLSFSDIVERLEISKGSASQGLQLLRSLGAVNIAEPKPAPAAGRPRAGAGPAAAAPGGGGDAPRREYYQPELGLRKLVSGVLRERVMPLATAKVDRVSRLRELAEQADGGEFFRDRVKQLETWRRRIKTVLPVLSALLGPKSKK
jgi:HTH-type transcriptional regulator, glycine betaine synthesis regulator